MLALLKQMLIKEFIQLKRLCLEKIRAESIKAFDQQLQ